MVYAHICIVYIIKSPLSLLKYIRRCKVSPVIYKTLAFLFLDGGITACKKKSKNITNLICIGKHLQSL